MHHILQRWKDADIVYLCPLADEVEPILAQHFNRALIGVTPQGWHTAEVILPYTDVLVLSEEDITGYPEELEKYIQ